MQEGVSAVDSQPSAAISRAQPHASARAVCAAALSDLGPMATPWQALYFVNRRLRSMLCVYSGVHACHPSYCCGPCPCVHSATASSAGEPQTSVQPWVRLDDAGKDGRARCCAWESVGARYARWDAEYDTSRRERTERFYARRAAILARSTTRICPMRLYRSMWGAICPSNRTSRRARAERAGLGKILQMKIKRQSKLSNSCQVLNTGIFRLQLTKVL